MSIAFLDKITDNHKIRLQSIILSKVKIFALSPCRFFKVMDDFMSTCGEGEFALLQIYFKRSCATQKSQ